MKPLEGIKVVEMASYLSGPLAGMALADLGAEVVKVEPPTGDPYRGFGRPTTPFASVWAACNRGKRCLRVDLKSDDGREQVVALLDEADVLVSNWRPDVAERLGIGDDVLAARNPRLVRCWISGNGPTGPRAAEPAFDTVIQARSGLTDSGSRVEGKTVAVGYPIDKLTPMLATQAILAALFVRERTGEGDRLDVAMLDAAAYAHFPDLMVNRMFLDHQPAEARHAHALSQAAIPASDGFFVVAGVSGRQIKRSCEAIGHPEYAADLFAQPDNAALLRRILELFGPVTSEKPLEHWLEAFRQHDVPAAPCLSIDEHLADEQVEHNRIYSVEDWPGIGRVRTPRYPAVSPKWGLLPGGGAPSE
jgi:crotonobetainyl-CoA:carnitine CoA-transferase CaiB-like acyl-CoA transferase